MYPSGSDCSSSYTDQGGPSHPINCSKCPVENRGAAWEGIDVVTSTLARGWADRGCDIASAAVVTSAKTTVGSGIIGHNNEPYLHNSQDAPCCQACTNRGSDNRHNYGRINQPVEWNQTDLQWASQEWSPCCIPDHSSCGHHGDESMVLRNNECCTMMAKDSGEDFSPVLYPNYVPSCQVRSFHLNGTYYILPLNLK